MERSRCRTEKAISAESLTPADSDTMSLVNSAPQQAPSAFQPDPAHAEQSKSDGHTLLSLMTASSQMLPRSAGLLAAAAVWR